MITPTQHRVLLLILDDSIPLKNFGQHLGRSQKTAEKHITAIYKKLGAHERISAARRAFQLGLADVHKWVAGHPQEPPPPDANAIKIALTEAKGLDL